MDDSEVTCLRQGGHVIKGAWLALDAAGEARPKTERITVLTTPDGDVWVRFGHAPLPRNAGFDLEPGERLYALLDDGTGVYERTVPQPGVTAHREIHWDGTTELRVDQPYTPN